MVLIVIKNTKAKAKAMSEIWKYELITQLEMKSDTEKIN
jgi:hypothetical protein